MDLRNARSLSVLVLSLATAALAQNNQSNASPIALVRAGFSHPASSFVTNRAAAPLVSPPVYRFASADFPGASVSAAFDENGTTVVGAYEFTNTLFAFTLSGGIYQNFTVPQSLAGETAITGINDTGEMVGVYTNNSDVIVGFFENTNGVFKVINETPAGSTLPYAINKSGMIVGGYTDTGGITHGFSTKKGTSSFTNFDFPGASTSPSDVGTEATGINTAGTIVGQWTDNTHITHGFTLTGNAFNSLDFPGATVTVAFGINDSNQIAGYYSDTSGTTHGFIYSGSAYSTVDVPGAAGTELFRIKNTGQITGAYADSLGGTHGLTGQ